MTFILQWGIALICLFGLPDGAAAQPSAPDQPVIRLTSAEWPPYSGSSLPENGASTAVIRAALAAVGYRLEVAFFPWRRTVAAAGGDSRFIGYFPEYLSDEVLRDCQLSDPIGTGPLGFAERADAPVSWRSLEDLSRYTIGIVDGYVNTRALDRRVRDGKQPADSAHNDAQNLIKLAAGRFPLAVVDKRVFEYLMRSDPQLRKIARQLRFSNHLLEEKQLYVCFRRDEQGKQARRILNEGLKRIDTPTVMAAALKRIVSEPLPLPRAPSTMNNGTEDRNEH
ncbi:MAG TPA: transporter substrate-binding domain-containing protein [Noviherbaspirillum sp.]|nr:transporter substrate-binding domain-containing protein [Noviherbaspirillum sp.]